jgi:hypothetical protein
MEQIGSQWKDFHEIRYLNNFRKSVEKFQVSLKSDKNNAFFNEDQYAFLISRLIILRMRNISGKKCRENKKKDF